MEPESPQAEGALVLFVRAWGHRREIVLSWVGFAGLVLLCPACSSTSTVYQANTSCCTGPEVQDPTNQDPHEADRVACIFGKGDLPEKSVSGDIPGLRQNVRHVFVIMMENRSFDHYFGALSQTVPKVDGKTDETNPGPDGGTVSQYHASHLCLTDTSHEWLAAHEQFDGGKMDGFVASSGSRLPMAYYDASDIPFYYYLAENFAIGDRHFASVMGPTWPNHFFFWDGTSCGFAEDEETNLDVDPGCGLSQNSIFRVLGDDLGVYDNSSDLAVVALSGERVAPIYSISDFEQAAAKETDATTALPKVVFIGATDKNIDIAPLGIHLAEDDDHPPSNIQDGQAFTHRIVGDLTSNVPLWKSSVLFITYDEHGGFYDHVQPPLACPPEILPDGGQTVDEAQFGRLGFRVPLLVVSPFVKRNYVSHFITDHTSILRFIETWLDKGAFSRRDANAWAMLDYFDFAAPDYDVPVFTADASPTPAGLADCALQSNGWSN